MKLEPPIKHVGVKENLTLTFRYLSFQNPAPGIWGVFRFDKTTWNIEVTGQSMLDFEYRILKDREMPHSQGKYIIKYSISFRWLYYLLK